MDKKDINKRICDRTNCFYWQTDRKISVDEASNIFKDRHSAITDKQLMEKVNECLVDDELIYIKPLDINSQESSGSVNSNRVGTLKSGKEVIIRCHPKGIKNGYFYVESLAASKLIQAGVPSYKTYCIHDLENEEDISFQLIEKLKGTTVQFYLKEDASNETKIVYDMGRVNSIINQIKVEGFGPFSNEAAKKGRLVGVYASLKESVNAGLKENLEKLVKYNVIDSKIASNIKELFENTELLDSDVSVLIHNDFPDWNALTDGEKITGVLDFDECVGGHPIQDIACWSTFFEPKRVASFIEGYFSKEDRNKYPNFEEMFNLFRLRYTISKLTLRAQRYSYEQTKFLEKLIENGKIHLNELVEIFNLNK